MFIPDNYNEFYLLAMDPGLHNIGIACFHLKFDGDSVEILSIDAETITSATVKKYSPHDPILQDEQFIIRQNMTRAVLEKVSQINPTYFVTETAFFNPTRPNSFAVLHSVITSILDNILIYDSNVILGRLAPQQIKRSIGIAGEKGKEPVKEAISKVSEITAVLKQPLDTLTEHAIDAVAVGYSYLTDILDFTIKEKESE